MATKRIMAAFHRLGSAPQVAEERLTYDTTTNSKSPHHRGRRHRTRRLLFFYPNFAKLNLSFACYLPVSPARAEADYQTTYYHSMYSSFLKPLYADIKTLILDTLFPISCLACKEEGKEFLCTKCKNELYKVHQICIMCHKPSVGGLTHPNCKTLYSPDGLISLLDYHDERVSKLIIHGKYYFVKDIYSALGKMLADEIKTKHPHLADKSARYNLVPTPLHFMRQNWRGFNQSEILCKSLANKLKLPTNNYLVRSKWTKTQKDLKKEARKANVENVFSVSPKILNPNSYILNSNFILVDDVATTGSTLLEAVKVLKQSGAKNVWCLTVAKD